MKVIPVNTPSLVEEFLNFPDRLYQHDPHYIRFLDTDVESVFDRKKNKFFKTGVCERFLFRNSKKETVGKVAVFVNGKYKQKQPTGGFGFFDCINDQDIANYIFDFCKSWLQEKGMEAMDGPINFGERDKFWGLLTEGFAEPLYGMNYHPSYYAELFKNYGFEVYFNQICYSRPTHSKVSRVFTLLHEKHKRNPAISARRMTKNKLNKFAKDFSEIYNKAWASHGEGKQIDEGKALRIFQSMKPVINEHISWFVYENEKPIAMWINIPDLNQWFKYLKGKFGWWQKLKFLWLKEFTKNTKMVGLVFGVVPEWQKKGIEGFMIWEGTKHLRKHTAFQEIEMQWIGDFNPKMLKIAESLDTKVTRKLATYRYLFDRKKEFERHPVL